MSKTVLLVIAILSAFAIIGMNAMKERGLNQEEVSAYDKYRFFMHQCLKKERIEQCEALWEFRDAEKPSGTSSGIQGCQIK